MDENDTYRYMGWEIFQSAILFSSFFSLLVFSLSDGIKTSLIFSNSCTLCA